MRAIAALLLACAPAFAGYSNQRLITLGSSSVIPASQTNFTVLFCANSTLGNGNSCPTVTGLNQSGAGARVQNSSGYDIVFSSTGCASPTLLSWEVEKYVASTGEIEAWVLQPSLVASGTIYLCYGNPAISSFLGGSTGAAWNSAYLAVYHFPNGTSLTTSDSTTNANNGSVVSTVVAGAGQLDGAANMAAAGYVQSTSAIINPATSTAFSASFWVSATTIANNQTILSCETLGGPWLRTVNTTGNFSVEINNTAGTSFTDALSINTWTHVVLVQSGAGTTYNLYVNGVVDATTATQTPVACTNPMIVGAASAGGQKWPGLIDEARVNNTALSANWIKTEYNNESSPSTFYTVGAATSLLVPMPPIIIQENL